MAETKQIQRNIHNLRRVKTWQLAVLLVIFAFVAATVLRLNNIGMIQRRDAVISADKQGDSDIMRSRLYDLQRYSSAHMNASTGVFYLEEQYHRDAETAKKAAIANSGVAENIYKKVDEEICAPQARANNWRWPDPRYTNCLSNELAKYPQADTISAVSLPAPETYRHSFVSPLWSPDFAGFAVLICLMLASAIFVRLLSLGLLHILLRSQKPSI